jgi:multisubunit Na+/H+ antiporter MnhF subunit
MGKEDMGIMNVFLYAAICFVVLALMLMIRLIKGPSVADRAVAADSIDILSDMALILYALHTGRGIYLDIALITAVLGFVGSTLVAKYLEGKL